MNVHGISAGIFGSLNNVEVDTIGPVLVASFQDQNLYVLHLPDLTQCLCESHTLTGGHGSVVEIET